MVTMQISITHFLKKKRKKEKKKKTAYTFKDSEALESELGSLFNILIL